MTRRTSLFLLFGLVAHPLLAQAGGKLPPIRLLALGDSFTAGTGSPPGNDFPARLAARWRGEGREVVLKNLAVNGYTTDAIIEEEFPAARGFEPTLVTLAIGANDLVRGSSPERYRSQLKSIFAWIKEQRIAASAVVVLPQPDWSRSPVAAAFGAPAEIQAHIRQFNQILREEATAAGARFLDLWPLMEKQAAGRMIAVDGLHPSAAAYAQWADALFEALPGKQAANSPK